MDQKAIEADIKNYKIRQGPLFKRSKFLKEWRQRWLVLTTNCLYTFTNKNKDELTDAIDLKQIKSYKSYLRKDQEMIPAGFKIRTAEDMYYLCAKNCNEKWSWIVSFERLMDYKYTGTSNYNNADWIRTKGFDSQIDFQTGKTKVEVVQEKQKSSEEAKKQVNDQAQSIIKQLQQQQKQLDKMKSELEKKEATFILEQKKIQQEKVKLQQQQKDILAKQAEGQKVVQSPKKPQPVPVVKKEEPPKVVEKVQSSTSRVAELRNIFEKKNEGTSSSSTGPKNLTKQESKQQKKQEMSIVRSNIVNSLFNQFRTENTGNNIIRYVTQFLINVSADETSGYLPFVLIQGKSNPNNKNFGEVVTQLIVLFTEFQKCENLMKFIEICIFQMPIIFTTEQNTRVQAKLKQIFLNLNNDQKLYLVIKNMFILNKIKKYLKNDIYPRLQKLSKESKNEQTRNWAAKLRDDL